MQQVEQMVQNAQTRWSQSVTAVVVRADRLSNGWFDISIYADSDAMGGGPMLAWPRRIRARDAVRFRNELCDRLSEVFEGVRTYGGVA